MCCWWSWRCSVSGVSAVMNLLLPIRSSCAMAGAVAATIRLGVSSRFSTQARCRAVTARSCPVRASGETCSRLTSSTAPRVAPSGSRTGRSGDRAEGDSSVVRHVHESICGTWVHGCGRDGNGASRPGSTEMVSGSAMIAITGGVGWPSDITAELTNCSPSPRKYQSTHGGAVIGCYLLAVSVVVGLGWGVAAGVAPGGAYQPWKPSAASVAELISTIWPLLKILPGPAAVSMCPSSNLA